MNKNKIGTIVCQRYGCHNIGKYSVDIVPKKGITYTVHLCYKHASGKHSRNRGKVR